MIRWIPRVSVAVAAIWVLLLGWTLGRAQAGGDNDEPVAFFEREVRPLLAGQCFTCHGPEKQSSGLRLDSRAAVLRGGERGPAVVPSRPEESLLIGAVRRGGDLEMPPESKLTERQVAVLARWVELGVPWPSAPPPADRTAVAEHWAFQPVQRPVLPAVQDAAWPTTAVDRFVLAQLEKQGLRPSPRADRRTLIRRLTMDLTGLLPTPQEVRAFECDSAPDAYERLVDRLLASPAYGEQWGRHWLDVARYSDTKGYVYAREERFWVHAWAYRDWVVRALNEDLPYDRFLLLQIAADQVAPDDPASLAALGFLTLGRRFLGVTHDIIDDRIDVVTRGTMALTVGCARCHDHKYDPIPTRDYYSLYGVFQSCSERMVPITIPGQPVPDDAAFAAELDKRQKALADALQSERAAAAARMRARVTDYLVAQLELAKYPEEGFDQLLGNDDVIPTSVRRWQAFLARTAVDRDPVFAPWHAFAHVEPSEFSKRSGDVARQLLERAPAEVNPLVARCLATAPASMHEVAERYGALLADIDRQWQALVKESKASGAAVPVGLTDGAAEALRQVLYGADGPCVVPDEPLVNIEFFFPTTTCEALWKLQGEVDRWLIGSANAPPYAVILVDRQPWTNPRVFRRGNPALKGEEVPRQFLSVLAGPDRQPFQHGSGRRELAEAIVDPHNPLPARVIANRVWMHHFGAGLVGSASDFGTRAGLPSHPELLDWLASELVESGWSIKRLQRVIVLSSVYRQSSAGPADPVARRRALEADAPNRFLWRANVHRLSFEELRDALLSVTGDLDLRMGGKPTALFTQPYPQRRTLYGLVDRQFLPNVFRTFDFANPDLHIPRRNDTTVAQQALFFLNHPFVAERARALAHRPEVALAATPADRVERLFELVLQRQPSRPQIESSLAFVAAVSQPEANSSATESADAPVTPLEPWEQLAQVLLLTNEFMFVD